MSALTRGLHALLAPLVLVAVLVAGLGGGWAPVAAVGLLDFVPGAPPFPPGDPQGLQDQRGAVTLEGKYKLAKVNVLGVPTITVASPIDESSSEVLGASIRARVIEGNLRALYDPNQICSFSERVSEWILDRVLSLNAAVCSAGQRYGLSRSGDPIQLVVLREDNGPYEIAARLPGRETPFPLLTVTRADAEINGSQTMALAQMWRERLEKRVNHARQVYSPPQMARRARLILVIELLLFGVLAGAVRLWHRLRQRTTRLEREQRRWRTTRSRRVAIRLYAEQTITIIALLLIFSIVVLMLGIGVMVLPGLVSLGIELLLQPLFAIVKFLLVTLLTFLLRSLTTFLLSQWAIDIGVSEQELERRQQRFRSLERVTHRLIDVGGLALVAIWVVLDIPGVRSASTSLILAGGALLGALALVFQAFLRDFFAGLVMLVEDRYVIGDWIEVNGIAGEVVDVGLFSTQIRCLDQRMNIIDNSQILQMRNYTKFRSGSLVTFVISHRQKNLEVVFETLSDTIKLFVADPIWGERLIDEPILRGVKRVTALGVQMQVLLITKVGEHWVTEREFQRRALQALHQRGVWMADGLELKAPVTDVLQPSDG